MTLAPDLIACLRRGRRFLAAIAEDQALSANARRYAQELYLAYPQYERMEDAESMCSLVEVLRSTGALLRTLAVWGQGCEATCIEIEALLPYFPIDPVRIVVEVQGEPTLEQMLAAFDPKKHGGEVMASPAARTAKQGA